jgi:hypothetical protein
VSKTSNAILLLVKIDHAGHVVPGQPALKLFHGHVIVCGVIQGDMANLNWRLTPERVDVREYILYL